MRTGTCDLPPRVIRFPHLQRRGRPTFARHARSARRAERAAGHAPRRAGPAAGGDAALAGRGRGRHAARTAITTLRLPPGRALGLTWRYGTLTATTLRTHGPKGRSGGGPTSKGVALAVYVVRCPPPGEALQLLRSTFASW
jgi:hypothetical protein